MTRARRAEDWDLDLANAREAEAEFAAILASDGRLEDLQDHTRDFERLDFSFTYDEMRVFVDLKEKRKPYSLDVAALWPEVLPSDLFILDETVYRRIVWQGGGGYLVIHDHPGERWAIFGPWQLTLGPRRRYQRWGQNKGPAFAKGKLLFDLNTAARVSRRFQVHDLLMVVHESVRGRDQVAPIDIPGYEVDDPYSV